MPLELDPSGLGFVSVAGRIAFGPALPTLDYSIDGTPAPWHPGAPTVNGEVWTQSDTHGVVIELEVVGTPRAATGDASAATDELASLEVVGLRCRATNGSPTTIRLQTLTLATTDRVRIGEPTRWRVYRNGYQSWAGTWTIGVDERDRDVPTRFGRTGVTDGRHPAASGIGHIRSDSVSAIVDPTSGDALAIGFTTLAEAFGFVEIDAPGGELRSLSAWVDLDLVALDPGDSTPWFEIALAAASNPTHEGDERADEGLEYRTAGSQALAAVVEAAGEAMGALGTDATHPGGWCSWYYYFTKVTEADILTNLGVLAADGPNGPEFGCEYVMVDDGHQTAIGDWLSTNHKFPSGMASVARRITDAGFDAGIWWAPFIVSSKSVIASKHPEWLVRDDRGRPILGLMNPGWGLTTPMRVLDTTHPEALDHIREVARVIGTDWGYRIQKIDFLFAAAHPGVRHDRTATRAQALRRGLQAVRDGSGPDGFILGCGSPLGPAVGLVDAMRIGADVTPSWSTLVARTVGRDRHALSTKNALLNTLTRSVFDGRWFLNDPDCLMVRDSDTKLTEPEVRLMCTVFGMTDGMVVLSDRMDRLPVARRELVARTRDLAGGACEVVDLFEHDLPRTLVSRHPDRVDVAVVNLTDRPIPGRFDLHRSTGMPSLRDHSSTVHEFWTNEPVHIRDGILELGEVAPHSARVVQLDRS